MEQNNKRYGLFTAITMIIGICIGSGIFFKSDNVLVATGGQRGSGCFCLPSGRHCHCLQPSLAMGQWPPTGKPGGIFTYFEQFAGPRWACAFVVLVQVFVYYPAITIVVSWVWWGSMVPSLQYQASLEEQILIGLVFLRLCFLYNVLWAKLGGFFQASHRLSN